MESSACSPCAWLWRFMLSRQAEDCRRSYPRPLMLLRRTLESADTFQPSRSRHIVVGDLHGLPWILLEAVYMGGARRGSGSSRRGHVSIRKRFDGLRASGQGSSRRPPLSSSCAIASSDSESAAQNAFLHVGLLCGLTSSLQVLPSLALPTELCLASAFRPGTSPSAPRLSFWWKLSFSTRAAIAHLHRSPA